MRNAYFFSSSGFFTAQPVNSATTLIFMSPRSTSKRDGVSRFVDPGDFDQFIEVRQRFAVILQDDCLQV